MTTTKAIPDPVVALLGELPPCRRLEAEEVRDVRSILKAGQSVAAVAGRLQIPEHVIKQIASGLYFMIVE